MPARLLRGALAGTTAAVGLALVAPHAAFAAHPDRVTLDSAPSWTSSSRVVAPADSSRLLHLTAVLALRDTAGAEQLADAVSDPASTSYGRYVTAAQWRARFAPTASSVASVRSWLADKGFAVTGVPANGRAVTFTGTVAQAEKAFGTHLADYTRAGRRVTAPTGAVTVPASLGGTVAAIGGLDTSAVRAPSHITPGSDKVVAAVPATSTTSSRTVAPAQLPPPGPVFRNATPCSTYYGEKPAKNVPQILKDPLTYVPCGYRPAQVRGAYGTDAALSQGYDARGATVAIVDAFASPTILKDAQTYATRNDPSHPLRSQQFRQLLPASYRYVDECGAQGWYGEETLDVEAAHATAPGADILYVGASSCDNGDINAAVNSIVDNDLAQVVSNSYGSAGEPSTFADIQYEHQTFLQAAAQGISMLFSSGDSGDETHDPNTPLPGKRQVDYEASDPYVTAVGGTSLAVTQSNGYGFEQGWGTGRSKLVDGKWDPNPPAFQYGGGGGTSRLFRQPYYQKAVVPNGIASRVTGSPMRAVPDVAMVGDPNTGYLVGQTQQFPDGSYQYSEYRIGGTSLSSPLFAGVVATATQLHGGTLGFLNPKLYRLAGTPAFRDVNHGRDVTDGVVRVDYVNGVNGADGYSTTLRTLNQTGTIYTRPGYDDVTGVGSPNGVGFLTAMAR